jgi:hypothetical protein
MTRKEEGRINLLGVLLLALVLMILSWIFSAIKEAQDRAERCPKRIVEGCQTGPEESREANAQLCAEYKARGCW